MLSIRCNRRKTSAKIVGKLSCNIIALNLNDSIENTARNVFQPIISTLTLKPSSQYDAVAYLRNIVNG